MDRVTPDAKRITHALILPEPKAVALADRLMPRYGGEAVNVDLASDGESAVVLVVDELLPLLTAAGRAKTGADVAGWEFYEPGFTVIRANQGSGGQTTDGNAAFLGHCIGTRTGVNAEAYYRNGTQTATSSGASTTNVVQQMPIGASSEGGVIANFFTGRITIAHGGAGLDSTQAAALTALFDTYATAAGET